jgi:hypothetical protein
MDWYSQPVNGGRRLKASFYKWDINQTKLILAYSKNKVNMENQILGTAFKVKPLGKLENFIGCILIDNEAKFTIWIHQPKLFKHLEQTFGSFIKDIREYKTPAAQEQQSCVLNQDTH